MAKGTIKNIPANKSFGFILPDDRSADVFFHASAVDGDVRFNQLGKGMEVEYETEQTSEGVRAKFVRALISEYHFLNPYNFVRFLPLPEEKTKETSAGTLGAALLAAGFSARSSSATPEAQLLSRCAPPPHDRYVGITGRISCRLETVTPLFISDPEGVCEEENGHKSYRFFQVNGQYAIPATSIRGVIRNVFEAVTNSCLHQTVFAGQRLSQRLPTGEARRLWPALAIFEKGKWWLQILPGTSPFTVTGPAQSDPLPAAWVMRYPFNDMQNSPTLKYKPNQSKPYAKRTRVNLPEGIGHGDHCWALIERMEHPPRPDRKGNLMGQFDFWNVREVARAKDKLSPETAGMRHAEGWLCINNQNIENKHDERFFFPFTSTVRIEITDDKVLQDYRNLIQDYQERHQREVQMRRRAGCNPAKRAEGETAFSRFILEDHAELRDKDLVYAMLGGTDSNPFVRFIVPVTMPRVNYEKSIADLAYKKGTTEPRRNAYSHLNPCDQHDKLCPVCRVFGWVYQAEKNETISPSKRVAYAGRVSFSHAILQGAAKKLKSSIPLAILSSPKPTTTAFYLLNSEGKPDFNANYNSTGARLRGRKFYRHHGTPKPQEYKRATDSKHSGKDNQNRTVRDVLTTSNQFTFTVCFEKLAPVELGALLWALEMDQGGYHRLGFAKPLGFGSVKVTVEKVEALDPARRYRSLTDDGWQQIANRGDMLVRRFKAAMESYYGEAFEDLENVQDLRCLLNDPPNDLPIHYPRPKREPDPEGMQYEWFVGNKRSGNQYALQLATEDTVGLEVIDKEGNKR